MVAEVMYMKFAGMQWSLLMYVGLPVLLCSFVGALDT